MLIKRYRVVWIKVHFDDNKHFHITLPISLYAFEDLLESVIDLLDVACFFLPKYHPSHQAMVSVHGVRELIKGIIKLLDSLSGTDPYDLVEVESDNMKVSVKFR